MRIKKLFLTVVLLAVCVCCVIPFAACDTLNNEDDWKEVQSITYKTDGSSKTLRSTCEWDISQEEITKEEYDNAPDKDKRITDLIEYPHLFNSK